MSQQKFKKGDIVISTKGTHPIRVTSHWHRYVEGTYLHNGRSASLLGEHCKLYTEESSTMSASNRLYSFTKSDGSVAYATYLATNGAGQWVVEEKGTGATFTLPKEDFEEVVPHTIRVVHGQQHGQTTHFQCDEGKVSVGELLYSNGIIYRVAELNTKHHNASPFKGYRIPAEKF